MDKLSIIEKIIGAIKSNDQECVEKLKKEILPQSLYKYRKLDSYTIDCLKRNTIWLSTYRGLNDPFESIVYFNFKDFEVEYFHKSNFEKEFYDTYGLRLLDKELNEIRDSKTPFETYCDICETKKNAKIC